MVFYVTRARQVPDVADAVDVADPSPSDLTDVIALLTQDARL